MESFERLKGMVFGLATGDALGVPVEFSKRVSCRENPVTGMRGFGTHTQPAGTWSDDASMTFCTMEAMLGDFSPELLGIYFLRWMQQGFWTPHGIVFDKGLATTAALQRLAAGTPAVLAGGNDEMSNGNGSLMRIAPLAWYPEQEEAAFFHLIREASSVTHGHPRSVMACHFYLLLLRQLFRHEPAQAWEKVRTNWPSQMEKLWPEAVSELSAFDRILQPDFASLSEDEIQSGGYVMHSLEASVWCLLNTNSYTDAVLKAINLGEDTDTTGAICGALAGTVYGYSSIPKEWIRILARTTEIENLALRFNGKFCL
jgi:ADP-ribosyl-[dinitrogen reductase] hydrolase